MTLYNLMPLSQRHVWQYFIAISAIAVACYGGAQLAVSTLGLGIEASPFWPPTGIALAALLLQGRRVWPGVALGSFFFCQSMVSWLMAIPLAFSMTLQAVVGAELLYRVKFRPSLERLQDVLQLVVLGACASTLINASLSTLVGCLGGTVNPQRWGENWWTLWVGDGMGILMVTPLLLIGRHWLLNLRLPQQGFMIGKLKVKSFDRQSSKPTTSSSKLRHCFSKLTLFSKPVEAAICFTLLCTVSWLVFGSKLAVEMARYPLEYLPFPLVVWAAIRFRKRGAVMATLIVSIIAIWGAIRGVGPFVAKTDIKQAVLFLQTFMGVVTVTALVLAAVESERACAVDLLKEREGSLANAQRLAKLGNWDFYETQQENSEPQYQLRWSDELYRIFGFTAGTFEPTWEAFFQVVHPADRERVGKAIRGALREHKPYYLDYRIVRPDGSERIVCEQSEIDRGGISGTVQDITDRQQVEAQLRATAERDRLLGEMALRIRRSLNLDQILNTTVAEVRQFLKADRVFIGQIDVISDKLNIEQLKSVSRTGCNGSSQACKLGQLNGAGDIPQTPNMSGAEMTSLMLTPWEEHPSYPSLAHTSHVLSASRKDAEWETEGIRLPQYSSGVQAAPKGLVIAESVDPCYPSLRSMIIEDVVTLQEWRSLFNQGRAIVIEDTTAIACSPKIAAYHCEYQVGAILGVPIWVGDELYGALVVNQCSQPRHWQSWEIDCLTALATQVAIAIQQAELYQQITDLNTHLESQVEERTQELSAKMTELQELNQLKDVFLQAVSHDLRTSLLGMSMVLNNLFKSPGDKVTLSRPLLERMMASNERQLNLINSLLDDHFNEQRQLDLNCQSIQLDRLIQDLIADYSPMLAQNQATLTQKLPESCPLIRADPIQLRQVLENLLTNALKHNPPGQNLTLQMTVDDHKIRCSLQDNGMGMSQEQQSSLFKLYIRGLHTKHLTGIGLGLYQCRRIIEAHGGEVGVITAPNAGSTFWFTLPLSERGTSN